MVVCKRQQGEENALAQKPLPRLSLSWMHCAHTTNEQPLRESDRSETKAKQTSLPRRFGSIYLLPAKNPASFGFG
jgi:hypothetical protein